MTDTTNTQGEWEEDFDHWFKAQKIITTTLNGERLVEFRAVKLFIHKVVEEGKKEERDRLLVALEKSALPITSLKKTTDGKSIVVGFDQLPEFGAFIIDDEKFRTLINPPLGE